MTAHPELVAYDGALDTELMRAHPRLVARSAPRACSASGCPTAAARR